MADENAFLFAVNPTPTGITSTKTMPTTEGSKVNNKFSKQRHYRPNPLFRVIKFMQSNGSDPCDITRYLVSFRRRFFILHCTQNRLYSKSRLLKYMYFIAEFRQLDKKLLTKTNTVKNVDFVHSVYGNDFHFKQIAWHSSAQKARKIDQHT